MSDPRRAATPVEGVVDQTDAEIEERVADIEETRGEMTATFEAIEERLSPANVIADAKQTLRDATVGRVEETVNDVTQTADRFLEDPVRTAQQTGSGLMETIRRNPLPAALIGLGVGWLALSRGADGRSRSLEYRPVYDGGSSSRERDWRSRTSGRGAPVSEGAGGGLGERVSQVGDRVSRGASDTAEQVGQAMDQVGQTVGQVPTQATYAARSLTDQASRLIESNPLGASVAALAVGTIVGMALPATQAEHQLLGSTSERLIEQAGETATQTLRTATSSGSQPSGSQLDSQAGGV